AQRRDIDDPKTITDFAAAVGDPSRLRMLYLLTYADMRAVGPGVLTPWQARILHELYARTLASLTGGRVARPSRTRLAERLLAASDVNIISAQIHTRADGIAIDTFQVNDPAGDVIGSPAHWARTLDALRAVLTGEQTVPALLARRRAAGRGAMGPGGPPKIALDNQLSDTATVIEVKCPDRLGPLYLITKTLA